MGKEKYFDGIMLNDSNSHGMVGISKSGDGHEIMASIDIEGDTSRLIIADITEDGAWICASVLDSLDLAKWA